MNYKILPFAMFLGLSACSSGSATKPAKSVTEGDIVSGAAAKIKDPSLADAAHPPQILVKGLAEGDLIVGNATSLEITVDGYPMEAGWQEAVVVLNQVVVEKFIEAQHKIELKSGLVEGLNRVVVYLQRSWGESLKNPEATFAVNFFYSKKDAAIAKNIGPGIFLVSPRGSIKGEATKKILFDFLVLQNPGKKYRVYYTLNGELREVAADAAPYFFYNLPVGNHVLKVELVDNRGKPLKTPFASAEAEFRIE